MRACSILRRLRALWMFGLLIPTLSMAQVQIGINIGAPVPPPPPIVIAAPPQLVVIPGTPVVYAPSVPYDYFVYGSRHYVIQDGSWYYAPAYRGPWTLIPAERVPRRVRRVPVAYYKIPPGHLKKYGAHREHKHKHKHKKHKHHDDD